MKDDIIPTVTLAKLYEAQYQLVDAINIYSKLKMENNSEEIKERIEKLTDIIFEHINKEYDPTIAEIFSPEELRYFRIIPGSEVKISAKEMDEQLAMEINPGQENTELDTSLVVDEEVDTETEIDIQELQEIEKKLKDQEDKLKEDNTEEDIENLEKERDELLTKLTALNEKINEMILQKRSGSDSVNNESSHENEV